MDLDTIKSLLEIQQSSYKDATALLFDTLNKRIEDQNKILYELRGSLEYSQEELRETRAAVSQCKEKIAAQDKELTELKNKANLLSRQVAFQEDFSRRRNIRIDGVAEDNKETWEKTQVKVEKIIKEKMAIENVKVEFAHRINNKNINRSMPRTIIARLGHDMDRVATMKNSHRLKGSNVFINEDLSEYTLNKRKEKLTELKSARANGKIAFFDKDKLIVKDRIHQTTAHATPSVDRNLNAGHNVSNLVSVFDSSTPANQVTTSPVSSRTRYRSDAP